MPTIRSHNGKRSPATSFSIYTPTRTFWVSFVLSFFPGAKGELARNMEFLPDVLQMNPGFVEVSLTGFLPTLKNWGFART